MSNTTEKLKNVYLDSKKPQESLSNPCIMNPGTEPLATPKEDSLRQESAGHA